MSNTNFDFDHWSLLARQDPAAFFALRERAINDFIASAPAETRAMLQEMQTLIDSTRAEAGTPMRAVKMMMGMMADQLDAMRGQLQQLREESDALVGHISRSQEG